MKILAVIPARGGSKRLPGKNVRPLGGIPLLGWSARFATSSGLFSRVVLSTDDPAIAKVGEAFDLSVPGLRPAELASDTATSADAALHALSVASGGPFDALALLQPTNPFRDAKDWLRAIDCLGSSDAPAIIGVSQADHPPQHMFLHRDGALAPLFPEGLKKRSQDLPETVFVNGSMYLVRTEVLEQTRSFFPDGTKAVLCADRAASIDIDTHEDFDDAEWLVHRRGLAP
ncbi:cytidylyltransferase domain-containing protein [Pseudooceanicola onchidii]|uniref:acylneuraminate cytidylyltransferase family protein n=1 Tax=Pseudooceanicola onchidii TaxID=2562279 RepID=UPI0010AA613D|nr:acylneuraminate cytidylyltransferase family protein [Pseudooceanicola onchidii]